jgi:hypothetical protein
MEIKLPDRNFESAQLRLPGGRPSRSPQPTAPPPTEVQFFAPSEIGASAQKKRRIVTSPAFRESIRRYERPTQG